MLTSFKLVSIMIWLAYTAYSLLLNRNFFRCILKFESTINLYNIYYY